MSKWSMRGHFQYLRFKTFPMTSRTFRCEVFWALLSNSKHSGVPEDSKSPTLGVLGLTPTLGQSGVATSLMLLPIWSLPLLGRDLWSWIKHRRYWFLLLSLMLLLLFLQQLYCLLKINIAHHCNILLSSLPLKHNLLFLIIIRLGHHNYCFSCPCLWLFLLFRRNVCRV